MLGYRPRQRTWWKDEYGEQPGNSWRATEKDLPGTKVQKEAQRLSLLFPRVVLS